MPYLTIKGIFGSGLIGLFFLTKVSKKRLIDPEYIDYPLFFYISFNVSVIRFFDSFLIVQDFPLTEIV